MVEQPLQASAFVANRSPVLRAEEVAAAEVVAEVVADWRMADPGRNAELRVPEEPRPIRGDAEALRMVVSNLVDNAGKHAPPGTPIGVAVQQAPGRTRIEVTDRGPGVPASDRERIFAPFTQLDASTTRRVGGVGVCRPRRAAARWPQGARLRGVFGLVTASALLVHLAGGTIEMHFHFFVVVGLITLYQDWVPFGLALLYVVVHHGVLGSLAPTTVFSHPPRRPRRCGGRWSTAPSCWRRARPTW